VEYALERGALLLGDRADDHEQVALAWREPRELGAEPRDVVLRRGDRHELHAAAGGHERVGEQRELTSPVATALDERLLRPSGGIFQTRGGELYSHPIAFFLQI